MCKLACTPVSYCPKHFSEVVLPHGGYCPSHLYQSVLLPPYLPTRSMITLVAKKTSTMHAMKSYLNWEEE